MIRLLAYSSIIFLIIMQVYVNESKPIFIPSAFLERAWPKDLNYPIERIDLSDIRSAYDDELIDTNRRKRNCLTYGGQQSHRSSKWMCW